MNVPQFTADASLSRTSRHYRTTVGSRSPSPARGGVRPQAEKQVMRVCGDCISQNAAQARARIGMRECRKFVCDFGASYCRYIPEDKEPCSDVALSGPLFPRQTAGI